jgi:hypothetical protein
LSLVFDTPPKGSAQFADAQLRRLEANTTWTLTDASRPLLQFGITCSGDAARHPDVQ